MKADFSLDDMRLFCHLANTGSFKQAAENLGIPPSTLSRRINQLESKLQTRLLHRNAHRFMLTESGQHYSELCAPLLQELSDIGQELHNQQHSVRGNIHISAPVDLGQTWLTDILTRFSLQYPEIRFNLTLSNRNINLSENAIDLAIRVGSQQSSDWIQRYLMDIPFAFYCGTTMRSWQRMKHLSQLEQIPLILSGPMTQWRLKNDVTGEQKIYVPGNNTRFQVDNILTAARATAAGLGISLLPAHIMTFFSQDELIPLETDWHGEARPVYMLYRDRENLPHRLRLLVDFILQNLVY